MTAKKNNICFESMIDEFCDKSDLNRFDGYRIFDAPLFGYGSPEDPKYMGFRDNKEAHLPYLILPKEWNPKAAAVVSVFLPVSTWIRESNRGGKTGSAEWAVGRVEGQSFIVELAKYVVGKMTDDGFTTISPSVDSRMHVVGLDEKDPFFPPGVHFTSTWSERHNAFICGLGTFGLSKGIITEKGMAGRLVSFITEAKFEPTPRRYEGLYDYCIKCNACVRNCPVGAIDPVNGKDHMKCAGAIAESKKILQPRYGCGKCQVKTPCEDKNPSAGKHKAASK